MFCYNTIKVAMHLPALYVWNQFMQTKQNFAIKNSLASFGKYYPEAILEYEKKNI